MKRKLVIFDWGGVLEGYHPTDIQKKPIVERLMERLGCPEELVQQKARDFFNTITYNKQFFCGTDKYATDYCMCLLDCIGVPTTLANIAECKKAYVEITFSWADNFELVKYVHTLYKRDVKIGLLSNLMILDKVKQDIDVCRQMFDFLWLSCDMGMAKPHRNIYEAINKELSDYEFDIMFIDDREENLKVPKEIGWKTFLMEQDNAACIEAIENFLRSE